MKMKIPHIENDRDFNEIVKLCDALLTNKGADYEVGNIDDKDRQRLSNFYAEADALGLTPYQVLGVYMHKHQRAIDKFLAKGRVESEPIEGRIADNINYLFLMYKMVQFEKRQLEKDPTAENDDPCARVD
jgi:hypothetical protein